MATGELPDARRDLAQHGVRGLLPHGRGVLQRRPRLLLAGPGGQRAAARARRRRCRCQRSVRVRSRGHLPGRRLVRIELLGGRRVHLGGDASVAHRALDRAGQRHGPATHHTPALRLGHLLRRQHPGPHRRDRLEQLERGRGDHRLGGAREGRGPRHGNRHGSARRRVQDDVVDSLVPSARGARGADPGRLQRSEPLQPVLRRDAPGGGLERIPRPGRLLGHRRDAGRL